MNKRLRGLTLVCFMVLGLAQIASAHEHSYRGGNGGLPSPFYDGSTHDLVPGVHLTFVGEIVEGKCLSFGQPQNVTGCASEPYIRVCDGNGTQYFPLEGDWNFWGDYLQTKVMISAEVRIYQAYGKTWNDVRDVFVLRPLDGSSVQVVNDCDRDN